MPSIDGIEVTGAACDSRKVEPGNLFICKGANFKPDYLDAAIKAGAAAVLMQRDLCEELKFSSGPSTGPSTGSGQRSGTVGSSLGDDFPTIVVEDIREAQAKYSKLAWGAPDEKLTIIGITGSKGKTTVATFVKAAVDACGHKCGFIGTHHVFDGATTSEPPNTTPEPPDLYRYLAHMVQNGCDYCVMEVSSQGLKYDRVLGLDLDVAAIINVGVDHISPVEHPTVEDYVQSKFKIAGITKKLFVNKDLVINEAARPFAEMSVMNLLDPGCETGEKRAQSLSFYESPKVPFNLQMKGDFNQANAECALRICEYLGLDNKKCLRAIEGVQVEGRMEIYESKDKKLVGLVDYAHNFESFTTVLSAVKKDYPDYFVVTYFGLAGGKALERYVDLPQVAGKFSDYVVVTTDEPNAIDPQELLEVAESNLPEGVLHECVLSRDEACKRAFAVAAAHLPSIVCALGKGEEKVCPWVGGDIEIIPDTEHVPQMIEAYDEGKKIFDLALITSTLTS